MKAYMLSKAHEYPIICQMARDYLAIPASSGPSERTFSYAGNLISKKRTRISSENVRYVLCLRSWGFLVDDDDEEEILFNENGNIVVPGDQPGDRIGGLFDPFVD
jgi:hAT family C-terminal dimerisation region